MIPKIFHKPISIFLASLMLYTTSCSDYIADNLNITENMEYLGDAIQGKTGMFGKAEIKTIIEIEGDVLDVTYDIQVIDENGKKLSGIDITYAEDGGKSILYLNDPQKKHTSALFVGTPYELKDYFEGRVQEPESLKAGQSVIAMAILAIITLTSITLAEISIIKNAYKIQQFYLSDYVTQEEDYILYCKDFQEIAELIQARTKILFSVSSILLSFATAGTINVAAGAYEIGTSVALESTLKLSDALVGMAIDQWGVSADEIVNKKIAVKVFPYEERNSFSNARNLFALYQIELNNAICDCSGNFRGKVVDSQTGDPIESALVKLQGAKSYQTWTNSTGEYSFDNVNRGVYQASAEKSGYYTQEKEVEVDQAGVAVNFVLSRILQNEEFRIVLEWAGSPADLDLHLLCESGAHIFWNNMGALNSTPYIFLDIDDRNGYGPETITVKNFQPFSIYINNWSQERDIKQSSARVSIYGKTSLLASYDVPTSGSGTWWHVFDLDSNRTIIEQNYLTGSGDPLKSGMTKEK